LQQFTTVHFLITPDLTPHRNLLPQEKREERRPLPLGEGWGEGPKGGLNKIYKKCKVVNVTVLQNLKSNLLFFVYLCPGGINL